MGGLVFNVVQLAGFVRVKIPSIVTSNITLSCVYGLLKLTVAGTEEKEGVYPSEPGCIDEDDTLDLVCMVNKVFALLDATETTKWQMIGRLCK